MSLTWSPDYAPVDADFADVSLLLKGEGTNGSTTILDSSSNNLSVTAIGDAQISTAVNTPFGTGDGVLAFDGTGDYLTVPSSSDFDFGTASFTIECWIWLSSGVSANQSIYSQRTSTSGVTFAVGTANNLRAFYGPGFFAVTSTTAIPTEEFTHCALTYPGAGSSFTLWINGINVGSSLSFTHTFDSGIAPVIGARTSFGENFNGYLSNLRITKGVARYTSNFTPPTAPFPILSPSGRITIADDSLDADARQYIINVEEQDGEELEAGVRTAINDFVVGCKSDGIWNAIKASCLLCGARTLEGALVPLKGGAPTKYGTEGGWNYNRETGLQGNGTDNYLDSNRANTADPQNSQHLFSCISSAGSNLTAYLGAGGAEEGASFLGIGTAVLLTRSRNATGLNGPTVIPNCIGLSRNSSSTYITRSSGLTQTQTQNSQTPIAGNIHVFQRNAANPLTTNARLSFYSIGESLDLAALDTRVSALITAIGAAIQ